MTDKYLILFRAPTERSAHEIGEVRERATRYWNYVPVTQLALTALFAEIVVLLVVAQLWALVTLLGAMTAAVLIAASIIVAGAPTVFISARMHRRIGSEGFNCPHCRKRIRVFEAWVCGQCGDESRPFWMGFVRTFFRPCRGCRNAPQYLKCPHCHVPIALVDDPDPNAMTVCARFTSDTKLLVYPVARTETQIASVPDGFEKKSEPPLVVAWRRARDDNLVIWWTRVGYAGFQVRGCRYPKVPTMPNEPDGQPVMAPSSAVTGRVDVGVSPGRHGNFGFWL